MELYIHIPFCRSKCCYCDFASWAGHEDLMPAYVSALLREAEARNCQEPIDTVFIGGGTPSVLPAPLLKTLLNGLSAVFTFRDDLEFTTEANPGTLTDEWLENAVQGGVNRLSMGMQAYQPALLQRLGRIHTFSQVEASVRLARSHGIQNINLDLMFGLPGQQPEHWLETLQAALSLNPQHLSCYGLIPEEGTLLYDKLTAGEWQLPDEDTERAMYDTAIRVLQDAGFAQYEISNFALPGKACRHNFGYWHQVPYIGLGASAASMLIDQHRPLAYHRETNPRTISDYLTMTETNAWQMREIDPVSADDACFEHIMLGLRTNAGVSETEFMERHGISLHDRFGSVLQRITRQGWILHEGDRWFLSRKGMDIQNTVLVEFMD